MKGIKNALTELNSKLNKKEFLKSNVGSYAPIIVFIWNGHTNEDIDNEIKELRYNNWYKHAIKLAMYYRFRIWYKTLWTYYRKCGDGFYYQ